MGDELDIDINVNMNNLDELDELTSKLDEATNSAETLGESLSDSLTDAESEAENVESTLEEIGETTISPTVEVDSSSVDETNEKLQETDSTVSSLTTALGGVAGMIGVDQMISTADRIKTSWNQLKLTFGETGVSIDELKTKTEQASTATGMAGSTVRSYFNQMGIAGVTNTSLLASSFESLAGRSYQTGQSIEGMEAKIQRMVLTGTASSRMLTGLGISTEALGEAMGVTGEEAKDAFEQLDSQGRLEALTKAMGDGAQANEMYKNSYAGLKQQAENSMAGLMAAIGEGVLPVINPMIQGATGLVRSFTSAFRGLPGPVQGVVGSLGGFLAVGTATIGTLGLIGQVGSGVVGGIRGLISGYNTARAAVDAYRNAEGIMNGIRAAASVIMGTETAAEGANAAVKSAAIAPTTGLAIAENSLLWPILLVTAAVIAVIGVLWYLYNTNETVRNAINGLAGAFMWVGQIMYNSIVTAVNLVTNALQGLWNYIMTLGGLLPDGVNITGNKIIDSILAVMMFIATLPIQIGIIFINVIGQALGFGDNFFGTMVQAGVRTLTGFINSLISLPSRINSILFNVLNIVGAWIGNFAQSGLRAATGFVNSVRSGLASIGGAIQSALSGVFNFITRPFKQAWDYVDKNILKPMRDAWNWVSGAFSGFSGYEGFDDNTSGNMSTLNEALITNNQQESNTNMTVNNNFNGLMVESMADYIVDTVNDRLRREKLLKGA